MASRRDSKAKRLDLPILGPRHGLCSVDQVLDVGDVPGLKGVAVVVSVGLVCVGGVGGDAAEVGVSRRPGAEGGEDGFGGGAGLAVGAAAELGLLVDGRFEPVGFLLLRLRVGKCGGDAVMVGECERRCLPTLSVRVRELTPALLRQHLPDVAALRKDFRRQLPATPAPRPSWPADAGAVPWGTLGHAIDTRLRLALDPDAAPSVTRPSPTRSTIESLLVDDLPFSDYDTLPIGLRGQMVTMLPETDPASSARRRAVGAACAATLTELTELIAAAAPHQQPDLVLEPDVEDQLCRTLLLCGWLEEVYRTKRLWPGSVLERLIATGASSSERLLAAVPAAAVADVIAMLTCCARAGTWQQLRTAGTVVSGPTFAGSRSVRGADADVIVGGTLIDIKATVSPERAKPEMFGQLLGYVLLDSDDQYAITGAGIFLARQGTLVSWTLSELLALAGATLAIAALRARCAEHLTGAGDRLWRVSDV